MIQDVLNIPYARNSRRRTEDPGMLCNGLSMQDIRQVTYSVGYGPLTVCGGSHRINCVHVVLLLKRGWAVNSGK